MQTGIYLRISQDRTGEAAGVTRQREDCIEFADQLGWQVTEIYQDNDTSASTAKPREQYRRMLADIEAGRVNAVVVWHPDRLYRRMTDLEELVEICDRTKLVIRTVRAGDFDLSTPTGKMIARILAATAQGEVDAKADRWLRSYRQRREAGAWLGSGSRVFGYDRKGNLVTGEAQIIRDAVTALLDGDGLMKVCSRLREQSVTTTAGNPWTHTSLRKLLRNPRIAGLVSVRGDIIGPGSWEPILDRDTWEQVRALVDDRDTIPGRGGAHPRSLLYGLTVCGYPDGEQICGRPLIRTSSSIPIYECRVSGVWSTKHGAISARSLESMVEASAQKALSDEHVRKGIEARLRPGVPDVLLQEIADHEQHLAELRESLKAARHTETRNDIITEMDRLRDEIADARGRLVPLPDIPVTGDQWPDDLARRSRLIRLAVSRVVVGPSKQRGGPFDRNRVRIEPTAIG